MFIQLILARRLPDPRRPQCIVALSQMTQLKQPLPVVRHNGATEQEHFVLSDITDGAENTLSENYAQYLQH